MNFFRRSLAVDINQSTERSWRQREFTVSFSATFKDLNMGISPKVKKKDGGVINVIRYSRTLRISRTTRVRNDEVSTCMEKEAVLHSVNRWMTPRITRVRDDEVFTCLEKEAEVFHNSKRRRPNFFDLLFAARCTIGKRKIYGAHYVQGRPRDSRICETGMAKTRCPISFSGLQSANLYYDLKDFEEWKLKNPYKEKYTNFQYFFFSHNSWLPLNYML